MSRSGFTRMELRTYGWVILLLIVMILLSGCGATKVKDSDGNETLASLQALSIAEDAAEMCMDDAKVMWDDSQTGYLASIPDGASETVIALLLMNFANVNAQGVMNVVGACMGPIDSVAQQYNLTDRQKMSSANNVWRAVAVGGFTFLGINAIANAMTGIAATSGGEYNILGPGARQVKQSQDPTVFDDGFDIQLIGDRSNSTPQTAQTPSAIPNGAVSSSGDGDVIGNTMNVNLGDDTSGVSVSIPNNSNDPVTGGEIIGDGGTIRANP